MNCLLRATRIAVASALLFVMGSAASAKAQDADPCAELSSLKNSGSDASGALTECLANVKGGSLELEPGFYSLEKPVKILDGVTLSTKGRAPESAPCNAQLGALCAVFVPGPGLSLGKGKGAAPGMLSIEGNDVSLHHLEFDGMNGLSGKQRGALLAVSGARGAKLSRLELRNWSGDSALMVSKAENVSVELSRFKDNGSEKSLTSHMEVKGGQRCHS